jgi:hypothetical protein
MHGRRFSILQTILSVAILGCGVAEARPPGPRIAPIDSRPAGQSYGRWASQWWQWALSIPDAVNPVGDLSGDHCAERQLGPVWFLAGSFTSDPVVRTCSIPAHRALFLPMINAYYGAFLNDPPETRTPRSVREAAACAEPVSITVRIDGVKVRHPERYFTGRSGSLSPLFNIELPPGNIYGLGEDDVPELALSPSAEQGYYLFVLPLLPGAHQIHWVASGCSPDFSQDVKYMLTVGGS